MLCVTLRSLGTPGGDRTVGSYKQRCADRGQHPSWFNAQLRQHCRATNKDIASKPCQNCSYALHVELCHITAVSTFSEDTKISEINSPENLLGLCRNCHWEFDNNHLTLEEMRLNELGF